MKIQIFNGTDYAEIQNEIQKYLNGLPWNMISANQIKIVQSECQDNLTITIIHDS